MKRKVKHALAKIINPAIGVPAENIVSLFYKLGGYFLVNSRISYAQSGEDLIISSLMGILGKRVFSYLDIGANDPKVLSNTYLMYKTGNMGILVEPNISMCRKLKKARKRDTVINCGVAGQKGKLTYYMLDNHTLNTFSKEEAERCVKYGSKIISEKEIEVITINEIMEKYGRADFLSVDVEGKDFEILKTLDFSKFAPLVICMETQEYCGTKRSDFGELNQFLREKGYIIYADTMLNTIYVDKKAYLDGISNL